MTLDPGVVAQLTVTRLPRNYLRVTPLKFAATPLGLGYGETRFASPSKAFRVLYLGSDLVTGIAETVIRDRFVGRSRRRLTEDELEAWGVTEVRANAALSLLDLRTTGPVALGVPTNAVRGKAHKAGRAFSERVYAESSSIDGILFASRLTNASCIAVYDRAVGKLDAGVVQPLIRQRLLIPALQTLNVEVIAA